MFDNLRPGPGAGRGHHSLSYLLQQQDALECVARSVNAPLMTVLSYTVAEWHSRQQAALESECRGFFSSRSKELEGLTTAFGAQRAPIRQAVERGLLASRRDFLVSDLVNDPGFEEWIKRVVSVNDVMKEDAYPE